MARKRLAVLVALMVILAGGITTIKFDNGDSPDIIREKDWPDAIPGERYDTRL